MNIEKIRYYEAEIIGNSSGALAVMNSWNSVMCPWKIPFTKNDLHQLYNFFKASYKRIIERNDKLTDEKKEQKKRDIDLLLEEAEQYDMSKMTSEPYYPHIVKDQAEIVKFIAKIIEVNARLWKIFMCESLH